MKTLATVTAALGLLGVLAAATPASAAMGQCFDAHGRPFGPPHNTDNPPYGMICQAYRAGGHCTHVQPQWAASNCGLTPRGYYNRGYNYDSRPNYTRPQYRTRQRDDHGYRRGETPRQREIREYKKANPGGKYTVHPDPTHPIIPDRGPPNDSR
jgi:hypothetical protein